MSDLTLNQYQALAHATQNRNLSTREIINCCGLKLAGEAGEVADEIGKVLFHGHEFAPEKIKKELGDVLWYVSELARACGYTLSQVAEANIAKLKARYPEGRIFRTSRGLDWTEHRLANIVGSLRMAVA